MKRIFLLFSILFPLSLWAQNTVNPNGYNVFYYGDSTISSEGHMRNGKPDGYWKTYYPTGQLKSEGNRRNFELDSVWVFYSAEGDTTEKISYRYGTKNGWHYKYQPAGERLENIPVSKELFVDGVQQGVSYYYYPDGTLHEEINYENGSRHGVGREFAKDGRLITIYNYRKGRLADRQQINRTDAKGIKQGIWKTFYDDWTLKEEARYKDGLLHGYFKQYSESGELLVHERYEMGDLVTADANEETEIEIETTYYNNGQVKSTGAFRSGTPVGVHRQYTETGEVETAVIYESDGTPSAEGIVDEAGLKQGAWKHFDENGNLRAEGSYSNDLRHGKWVFYYPDGTVEQSGKYSRGNVSGKWKWFYESGELLREEMFLGGREEGLCVEYAPDGEVITRGEYLNGLKHGEWYYHVGDHTEEGPYMEGKKHGIWRYYYLDGELKFEGEFRLGNAHEKHLYYYPDGVVKEERNYVMGRPKGEWIRYDEHGAVIKTITYEQGRVVKIDNQRIKYLDETN